MEIVEVGLGILAALREPIGFGRANRAAVHRFHRANVERAARLAVGDPSPPPAVLALMGLA